MARRRILIFTALVLLPLSVVQALPSIDQGVILINLTKITNPETHLSYFTAPIPVAFDPSTATSTQLSIVPDISESRFIAGLEPQVDFGIACTNGSPSCTVPNIPSHTQEVYKGTSFDSIKGSTNSWWNSGKSDQSLTLAVDLDTSVNSKDWVYGRNSVLGLSPSSEYLRFLGSAYKLTDGNNIFSLYLALDDINDRYNPEKNTTYAESFLTLNGYQADHLFQLEPIIWAKQGASDYFWSISGLKSQIGKMPEIDSSACIVWSNDYYLLVESVEELLTSVNQEICGKDDCDGQGSIENGPEMTLKIDDIDGNSNTVTIEPSSYIYLDNETTKFQVSAANIKDFYSQECSDDQKIGFGKQFFLDFYLIYKTDSDGVRSIGIGEVIPKVVFTNQELVYIVMGGITGVMTLIYILRFFHIAYKNKTKGPEKEKDEGEYYGA